MHSRQDLQNLLEATLGSKNVYYQPPESIKLKYPCIVYQLDKIKKNEADNKWYRIRTSYQATLIYKEADSTLPYEMVKLDSCAHVQHFKSDNLYHDVYSIEF